ncbi:MAG: AMP-binding protein [Firmicutes bacterium]|nr:AMP-binding protein [Bacillota bacterium]
MSFLLPLNEKEKENFDALNKENLDFIRRRYNKVNRWVIADMVRRSAYRYPNKPALIFNDKTLTFSQLEAEANRFSNSLLAAGIKKYDRVAILAHNTIHHVITWLGTAKAGGVYLAVNYLLRGKDISFCINHSESKVFIVEDTLYNLVKDVLDDMPTVKTLVWSNQGNGIQAQDGFYDFDTWYKEHPATEPDAELNIEDPVQMTYTSGTETLPKGVILNNQSLISEYTGCIIDGEYSPDDICLNALPIFHCAQRDCFLNPCLMLGATNILLEANPKQIMQYIEKYKATMFFAPPTVWIGLLRHPDFDKYDLSSVTKGYYGASIMPVEVLKELQKRFPNCQRFYNYYGQTELSPYHTILKPEFQISKAGSAGMGGLNMESRIENTEHEPINVAGEPGEICGRGPHSLMLYFKEADKTEQTLAHGWFHSGDIGVLDEDSYITVVDRKKDMVKTGGENVPSREVEEVIYQDSRVSEVAVIGLPHETWVEGVTAAIVPKAGQIIKEEEIINLCQENLARFKVPKGIVFIDELPKTPSGKILKRDLRQKYSEFYK